MSVLGVSFSFIQLLKSKESDEKKRVLLTRFLDIVVDGNDGLQDVAVSAACLEAVLWYIRKEFPQVKKVVLLSDNGPHFSSHDMLGFITFLNRRLRKDDESGVAFPASEVLQIVRYMFTESQCGKDRVDTHFAFLKSVIKDWVNRGNNVTTPREIFAAATKGRNDGGGVISGSAVALLKLRMCMFSKEERWSKSMRDQLTKARRIRSVGDIRFPLASHDKTEVQLSELCIQSEDAGVNAKAYKIATFTEASMSAVEQIGFFCDFGCRISSSDPTSFQSSPMQDCVAPERQKRDPSSKLAQQSSLEKACAEAYREFCSNHIAHQQSMEAEALDSRIDVDTEIANVLDVSMVRTVAKRRRKGQIGDPELQDIELDSVGMYYIREAMSCAGNWIVTELFAS